MRVSCCPVASDSIPPPAGSSPATQPSTGSRSSVSPPGSAPPWPHDRAGGAGRARRPRSSRRSSIPARVDLANCQITLPSDAPQGLVLTFQTTDPTNNLSTGQPNQPVTIPAGQSQSFIVTLASSNPVSDPGQSFLFTCDGSSPAPIYSGINTADLTISRESDTADDRRQSRILPAQCRALIYGAGIERRTRYDGEQRSTPWLPSISWAPASGCRSRPMTASLLSGRHHGAGARLPPDPAAHRADLLDRTSCQRRMPGGAAAPQLRGQFPERRHRRHSRVPRRLDRRRRRFRSTASSGSRGSSCASTQAIGSGTCPDSGRRCQRRGSRDALQLIRNWETSATPHSWHRASVFESPFYPRRNRARFALDRRGRSAEPSSSAVSG